MFSVQLVRLYPTDSQQRTLDSWMRTARRIWNHFLEHRVKIFKRRGESASKFDQFNMLTKWRENDERIRAMPVEFQRDALDRLCKAFDRFFQRVKAGEKPGFPRFKGIDRWHSMNYAKPGNFVHNGTINIPKLGLLKCRNLRPVDGTIKSLRVVKRSDRWFAQLLIDDGLPVPEKIPVQSPVGMDVGLNSFASLSDGTQIPSPQEFRRMERKLQRASRSLSRKKKGSKRRLKAKRRLARVHLKIADRRSDFTHKLSKCVVKTYDLIAVEDLNVKGMVKNRRLSKSISDAAWGQFIRQLSWKAERAAKTLVRVDAKYTSQECSQCGHIQKKTLAERTHNCDSCGLSLDRDVNAARNILSRAIPPVGREFTRIEKPTPGRRKTVGALR